MSPLEASDLFCKWLLLFSAVLLAAPGAQGTGCSYVGLGLTAKSPGSSMPLGMTVHQHQGGQMELWKQAYWPGRELSAVLSLLSKGEIEPHVYFCGLGRSMLASNSAMRVKEDCGT